MALNNPEKSNVTELATLTLARLVMNMTRRFPYPFLPEISRQLGVSLDSVQNVMAVNAGVGIGSPLLGPIGERYGRKRVMMGSLILMMLASAVGAIAPQFGLFAGVMIAFGIVKMVFAPAISAYIGDHIPYERRGTAIGVTELSWAGSLLVAALIVGFLLGAFGLQSVFLMLLVACLLALAAVYRYLPADHPNGDAIPSGITPLATWRALRSNPVAFRALTFTFLFVIANEIFFINYSAYMETTFDLALTALGIVTVVIAVAEVCGEFAVIGFADRYGKRRVTLIGVAVSSIGYILLPVFSFSLPLTLAIVFLIFFMLESAIVASVTLYTEILPDARAIMMSSYVGAESFGRLVGGALGGWLYVTLNNFSLISTISTTIAFCSLFLLWRFVHEKQI
ncbi:MAG: MFS transporter [Anaerolineae bacterium]|nr:MFS transporter [Anaerolineae bacterium]